MSPGASVSRCFTGTRVSTCRLAQSHRGLASSSWQVEGGLCPSTQSSSMASVQPCGVALGILQEQTAQRENRREPQCLGVGPCGRRPFPPCSACSSDSVCSAQTGGQGTRLCLSEGRMSKDLKPPQSTFLHLLCPHNNPDCYHFLLR